MKVGDLVKIDTFRFGTQLGVLVKALRVGEWDAHWQVRMFNHSDEVYGMEKFDLEVISESR